MAVCNYNDLLDDGRCYAALPVQVQNALVLQLWCDISGGGPPPSGGGGIINPDAGGATLWNPDVGAPIGNPEA